MSYVDTLDAYLRWRGSVTLSYASLTEADVIALTLLAYINFENIVPEDGRRITIQEAAKAFAGLKGTPQADSSLACAVRILGELADTVRFRYLELSHYRHVVDESVPIQYGALQIHISPFTSLIAFRGTDDDLVGWKENLFMCSRLPYAGQARAVEYLNEVMGGSPFWRRFLVTGHSKGGSVAKYAAIYCEPRFQKRIKRVISLDGPGFYRDISGEEAFLGIADRMVNLMPEESLVGVLLRHPEACEIVKSYDKGVQQHSPDNWKLQGDGSLVRGTRRTDLSYTIEATIDRWVAGIELEERERFIEVFFDVVQKAGIHTYTELTELSLRKVGSILKAMSHISSEDKSMILNVFKLLLQAYGRSRSN